MDKITKKQCTGFYLSGGWKGRPCPNTGKYKAQDNKWYCGIHYPIASHAPERMQVIRTEYEAKEAEKRNLTPIKIQELRDKFKEVPECLCCSNLYYDEYCGCSDEWAEEAIEVIGILLDKVESL